MKRYLPLLGIFLLFFLVVSGFAHAAVRSAAPVSVQGQTWAPQQEVPVAPAA